jgi:excisionase family DNA binding protein
MTTLLTLAEVAEQLRVSVRTVRRLAVSGALPLVRLGGAVRIDPSDLATLIHTHKARPAQPEASCRSTNGVVSGGFASPRQTTEKYGSLLKLPTIRRPLDTQLHQSLNRVRSLERGQERTARNGEQNEGRTVFDTPL